MTVIWFLLSIVGGFALYWVRNHSRLSYGAIQIAAAVLLLYLFFFPKVFSIGVGGEGFWGDFLTNAVTWFAGLYAMVQGLENVVTALREPEL